MKNTTTLEKKAAQKSSGRRRRAAGPDIRKVASGSYVNIRLTDGDVVSGRLTSIGAQQGKRFAKVRQGAGETVVEFYMIAEVIVDVARGVKNAAQYLVPAKENQKHRIMARYAEL